MSDEHLITVRCYDRAGALADVIEKVDLGDRSAAASHGRESLHTAALWGAIAIAAAPTPPERQPA